MCRVLCQLINVCILFRRHQIIELSLGNGKLHNVKKVRSRRLRIEKARILICKTILAIGKETYCLDLSQR